MTTKKKIIAKDAIRKISGAISFGLMLYSYRLSRELNQTEMANILDISKQDLCNIEKGRKLVSVERAMTFAKALSMPTKTFAKYALQDQLFKAGLSGEVTIS
ncbi:MAG: helix-turn-helix transcriptional regulator [Bacteriovoracaceae bacterium]|jgi:antitoxin HigA-1|nr:helix-turn-helix transcriptional regulator [Bacteriovoracaceae bacterium]